MNGKLLGAEGIGVGGECFAGDRSAAHCVIQLSGSARRGSQRGGRLFVREDADAELVVAEVEVVAVLQAMDPSGAPQSGG